MKVWVIIPAFNEQNRIGEVIKKIKKFTCNIVVIDDNSSDRTKEIAKEECEIVLRHKSNLGKGAALKTGCEYALKHKASKLILIDADGQHNPDKIPLIANLLDRYEIVFTRRSFNKNMPLLFRFGNWALSLMIRFFFGIYLHDTQCGYRGFRSSTYEKINWISVDYSVETDMVLRVGKLKLNYIEIPIETVYHDQYKGTTVLDGLKIGLDILKWKFSRSLS